MTQAAPLEIRRIVRLVGPATLLLFVATAQPSILLSQHVSLHLEEFTVQVDGTMLSYRVGGAGPPILFVHGGSRSGHDWDRFLDALGEDFTVILPELPGHGHSERLAQGLSLQAFARVMFGLLDELGVEQFRGVGHSLGANTLLHMAAQQPQRVQAMVLVAGGHRLMNVARDALSQVTLEDANASLLEYYRTQHPGGASQVRAFYGDLRTLADNYEDFAFSLERLAAIPTRTLLVWGDRDALNPVEIPFEMYDAMPNASLWVVPDQGHMLLWADLGGSAEVEATFAAIVADFFGTDGAN